MKRVLIVDDDGFYAGLVAKAFGQRRWLPVVCHTMEDALKEIDALKVDLIVTDIFMPGIGGIEGIELLKTQAPDVPVIAMSGGWDQLPPDEAVKAAIKVGARGGLAKPIQGDLLDAMLKDLGLGGSKMGEPNWPQTVNETTDWDEVFDAPVNGLMAWISNAESFDLLKISAINMLDHLFQNTRTKQDAAKYKERLKDILSQGHSGNHEQTLTEILRLLGEIKGKFKDEDARYIAARNLKNFEKRRDKRRAASAPTPEKPWHEKYAIPIAGVVLVAVIALVVVLGGGEEEVVEKATEKKITQTERKLNTRTQMGKTTQDRRGEMDTPRQDPNKLYRAPEGGAQPWRAPSQKFEKPKDADPDLPPVLALAAVEWSPTPLSPREAPVRLVPLLTVDTYEKMKIICDRAPAVTDMINVAISQIPDDGNVPTGEELKQAAMPLAGAINASVDLEVVKKVTFITGAAMGKVDFINDACRPLMPKEIRALDLVTLKDRFPKP